MGDEIPNRSRRVAPGRYEWCVDEGWRQGRGAFGGLVLSALARAMRDEVQAPGQTLRSLTAVIPTSVAAGPAEIRVEVLRSGNNTTTLDARIVQDGEVRTQGTGIFARARDPELTWCDLDAPEMPPWETIEALPYLGPPMPEFMQHLEVRVAEGPVFGGSTQRVTSGWVRLRKPTADPDELDLVALIDGWWGAALAAMSEPRPAGTMSFSMQIVGDWEGLDPRAPLFFCGRSPASREGYTVDLRELWSADGRLLALNQQTLAIIK